MLTRCPHCQTTFRVSPEQLDIAKGKVRCGKCQQVFNAREHISQATETPPATNVVNDTPPTPPPQVDWLQQARNSLAEIEKINLTSTTDDHIKESAAPAQEMPESDLPPEQHADAPTDEAAPSASAFDDIPSNEIESETTLAEDEDSTEPEHTNETNRVPGSYNTLIPGNLDLSFQEAAEARTLEGIAPAYEDDSRLNAREEQGLDDLHSEIERQLQTPESEAEDDIILQAPTNEREEDETAFVAEDDSETEYDEASAVEDIELNALPEDKDSSVIWNEDTHHDPEIPAALRSSMQALEKNKKRHPIVTLLMAIVLLILIAGLGAQAIVFRSYDMATQWPQTRPWLSLACHYLPCVYTGHRDPRKIQLVNRDIRALPSAKHALLISATLLNQASYAQPFPRIDIKLSDLSGEPVAERIFSPRDYLKKSESSLKLLRPNIPTVITLEVLDPGSDAVNFEFRFL